MSNYVKSTNFTAKDSLPTGDTNKVIRGSEFDTEFNAIVTAISTKSDLAGPTFTGTATFADITGTGTINFTGATVSNLGSVTTVDINGGTIDGVTIGGSSAGAGTFSSLTATTADINGGTVDGVTIGGSSAGAGTFSSLTATTADINAGTVDNTVIGGTTPAAGTFSSLTATTANIDGGSIDGAVIGGSTPAAISGTTGTFSGAVSGTTGTFSGAVSGTTGTFSGAVTGSNLNISNWDTAFGWGDHSTEGYLTSVTFSDMDAGAITTSGETFANSDTQIPTNAAVRNWVLTTYPTIVELNDLTANVTWATVPDAYISASSVNQHVSVEKATQSKTYTLNESSTITLSSSITSGVPVVSVTKEVPQTGVTNNNWDVNSTTENYTRLNSAPATTLDFVGYDISNASYASKSFSVASEDTTPFGIAFNTTGTKMYMVGNANDTVYQYSLSTAFDVSTASYDSVSFSISSQETSPGGLTFNTDGTKMYVIGYGTDAIYEYDLSTGFDLSTASYNSVSFSVASQATQPHDVLFKSDGTKMYVIGATSARIYQYSLSTAFDLSTASYDSVSLNISGQDGQGRSIAFNSDGTKLFFFGNEFDNVHQYSLSTAYDLSTASYDSVSFSVASQDGGGQSIAFNNNGTKMFMVGTTNDTVYEYNISVGAVSLGTGSFASADVGKTIEANSGVLILTATDGSYSEVTAPTSYDQVASGSWEMYAVVYNTTDGDLELSSFSQGYDISNSSYVQSFSVSSEDDRPHDVKFNNDGTKMFVVGQTGEEINEYDLTTAYDISTASYSQRLSTTSEETSPTSIAFNTDGTKMFVLGIAGDEVNEYNLSTAFDLSTATASQVFSVSTQETIPEGLAFNTDGTKMYVVGTSNDTVFEYDLTTGFDISTASYSSRSFSVNSEHLAPTGLAFNNDGTKMFIIGSSGDKINEYNLSTAFDVSTASYNSVELLVGSNESNPEGITFNADGTRMFIVGVNSDEVQEYTSNFVVPPSGYHAVHTTTSTDSQYWTDINSMTADEAAGDGAIYYAVSTDDRTTWKIAKSTDGERSIVRNNSGTWQYNSNGTYGSTTWSNAATNTELAALQEAMEGASENSGYDLSAGSYDSKSVSVSSQDSNASGIWFKSDGTEMFICGFTNDSIFKYTLSTAWDVSTASYSSTSTSLAANSTQPRNMAFSPDGTNLFVVDTAEPDSVFKFTLSTAWDITTISYSSSFNVSAQATKAVGIQFKSDGTKMYVLDTENTNTLYQYSLSTAWDITTASYDSKSLAGSGNTTSVFFHPNGIQLYLINYTDDTVYGYDLSTAWDISTASLNGDSLSVAAQITFPAAIFFANTGSAIKMYALKGADTVFQYSVIEGINYPNQMNKTQLDAVPDANHFTLGDDLDLAIIFNMSSGTTVPSSDGVSINFDATSLNQGAVLGTDYNWDFPAADKVRITSLAAQNLKVRII